METIYEALGSHHESKLKEFDKTHKKRDLASQRDAVRAAKSAKRLHSLLFRIERSIWRHPSLRVSGSAHGFALFARSFYPFKEIDLEEVRDGMAICCP